MPTPVPTRLVKPLYLNGKAVEPSTVDRVPLSRRGISLHSPSLVASHSVPDAFDWIEPDYADDASLEGVLSGSWIGLGPFRRKDLKRFDEGWLDELIRRSHSFLNQVRWVVEVRDCFPEAMFASVEADSRGCVNLVKAFGAHRRKIFYVWSEFQSPHNGFVFLQVESTSRIRVWINGEQAGISPFFRNSEAGKKLGPVSIRRGLNRCLIRLDSSDERMSFRIRLVDQMPRRNDLHLQLIEPVIPPVVLLGAAIPVDQLVTLPLFNDGTGDIEDFHVVCRSEQIRESRSASVSCAVGRMVDVPLRLEPSRSLLPGEVIHLRFEAVLSDGTRLPLTETTTHAAPIHSLLRVRTEIEYDPFFVVQLSDPHIEARETEVLGVRTADRLIQAVEEINRMNPAPDFVVVTGDLLLDRAEGYPLVHEILSRLKIPHLCTFGNHDKPEGLPHAARMLSQWGLPPYSCFVHKGYRFFLLDTVASPRSTPGRISAQQLRWLEERLGYGGLPRVFFLHHDLFSGVGVKNYQAAQELLKKHPGEKWFFSGHWHSNHQAVLQEQHHVVTSSTAFLFDDQEHVQGDEAPVAGYRLIYFDRGHISTSFKSLGSEQGDAEVPRGALSMMAAG